MACINYESNQQDALYRLIYYSKSAVHVSGDILAHHQEHLTIFTVSGSVHPSCCPAGVLDEFQLIRLYSFMFWELMFSTVDTNDAQPCRHLT